MAIEAGRHGVNENWVDEYGNLKIDLSKKFKRLAYGSTSSSQKVFRFPINSFDDYSIIIVTVFNGSIEVQIPIFIINDDGGNCSYLINDKVRVYCYLNLKSGFNDIWLTVNIEKYDSYTGDIYIRGVYAI